MSRSSAFTSPIRSYAVYDIPPPAVRLSVQVTAGCQQLYKNIKFKKESNVDTKDGCYTDSEGSFTPCDRMPLLASRYQYIRVIGAGQSAVLIEVKDTFNEGVALAVKVLNLHYTQLGAQEADCIRCLTQADPHRVSGTLKLHTTFTFRDHYCMVFDRLDPRSLLEYKIHTLSPQKSLSVVREVAVQLLKSLGFLYRQNIIHGDLKPENVLLSKAGDFSSVQLVDFGNAIRCVHEELSLYYDTFAFQTLLYRAPEVVFGLPFGLEVDTWSLGCMLAELYIGRPLFFASNTQNLLDRMVALLGPLPSSVYQRGKFCPELKNYIHPAPQPDATLQISKMLDISDVNFAHFLAHCLRYDPGERIKVWEAAQSPFIGSQFGFTFLMAPNSKGPENENLGVIQKDAYPHRPRITNPASNHMTSREMLRHGTRDQNCEAENNGNLEKTEEHGHPLLSPWKDKLVIRQVAQVVPVQRKTPTIDDSTEGRNPTTVTTPFLRPSQERSPQLGTTSPQHRLSPVQSTTSSPELQQFPSSSIHSHTEEQITSNRQTNAQEFLQFSPVLNNSSTDQSTTSHRSANRPECLQRLFPAMSPDISLTARRERCETTFAQTSTPSPGKVNVTVLKRSVDLVGESEASFENSAESIGRNHQPQSPQEMEQDHQSQRNMMRRHSPTEVIVRTDISDDDVENAMVRPSQHGTMTTDSPEERTGLSDVLNDNDRDKVYSEESDSGSHLDDMTAHTLKLLGRAIMKKQEVPTSVVSKSSTRENASGLNTLRPFGVQNSNQNLPSDTDLNVMGKIECKTDCISKQLAVSGNKSEKHDGPSLNRIKLDNVAGPSVSHLLNEKTFPIHKICTDGRAKESYHCGSNLEQGDITETLEDINKHNEGISSGSEWWSKPTFTRLSARDNDEVITVSDSSNSSENSTFSPSVGATKLSKDKNCEIQEFRATEDQTNLNATFTIMAECNAHIGCSNPKIVIPPTVGEEPSNKTVLADVWKRTNVSHRESSSLIPSKVPRLKQSHDSFLQTKENRTDSVESMQNVNNNSKSSNGSVAFDAGLFKTGALIEEEAKAGNVKPTYTRSVITTNTPSKARRVPITQEHQSSSSCGSFTTPLRFNQLKTIQSEAVLSPLVSRGKIRGKPGRIPLNTPTQQQIKSDRVTISPQPPKTKPGRTPIRTPSRQMVKIERFETPKGMWTRDLENFGGSPMLRGVSRSVGKAQRVPVVSQTTPGGRPAKAQRVLHCAGDATKVMDERVGPGGDGEEILCTDEVLLL